MYKRQEQRSTTTQDLRKLTCSRPTNKILQPPAKSKVRHAGYPRPSRRERHRFGPATRNGKPALAGQAPSKARDECLGQGPSPEPLRGGSNRLPLGAANVPPSSNSRVHVRGHGRKMIWHHGAFGGKVPLLRCSRRGHAPRAHVIESRNAGEPTPAASQRDLPPARRSELGFFTKLNSGHPSRRTGTCGWTSSCGEAVLGTLRTENTGRSPSCWRSPRQTHKRRYTCKEAMPTTMDQPPLLRGVQAPTLWSVSYTHLTLPTNREV